MLNVWQVCETCRRLVVLLIGFYLFSLLSAEIDNFDFLLCRHCGHEVTKAGDIFNRPSVNAIKMRNSTILGQPGVLIQLFKNPQGNQFEVITAKTADVYVHEKGFSAHSWFQGFAWHAMFCPRCGYHLGWFFETAGQKNDSNSFYGLILHHLLHKDFADSLLITPKSYYS